MNELTLVEAVRLALARALEDDPRVILLGEDIGVNGGVFRATDGLAARFGADRVRDTPLAETAIAGIAVGAAAHGLRPVAEIQFMGFLYPALDQLANHAARLRNRTRGRLSCPMVLRAPFGGGIHAPEHHSESFEAMLAHVPGLRVVVPSSPARAYGLLLAAIRDPDPVVFLEPKRLYRSVREEVADDGAALPLDRALILSAGDDVTLVTWGAMVQEAREAVERMATEGVLVDLIDLCSLKPIDRATIRRSVAKTGRCVVLHEAPLTAGLGAEIAADLAEHCLTDLLAPIRRVAPPDVVIPYPRLEDQYMPTAGQVVGAIREVMEFS
ncbi:alpha-ketoacid dehydrogenase subunit beta [Aliiruegeria sabulilitoris]|uniref:alpha-ketoacid dehydrogenase subunit beta n=1 Tax=Aliiruegeria sabulilitoris TaxID=1510458 RepID=UPI0008322F07|nr:alpha-ketoacid dehydrogenase subunit beta [Aliiruegeria sabulilitoris]NDR58841.1 alpha-ketoacid dehydrogenase subunit beta [Pseudoruegeria sp. M32A2M]